MEAPRPSRNKQPTVIALLEELAQLERALAELQAAGFTKDQIGFICPVDRARGKAERHNEETTVTGAAAIERSSWGISAGVLPDIGQVVSGGTLNGVLASAVLGAPSNGLVDALISSGLENSAARRCATEALAGKIVLTVRAGDRSEWVKSLMWNHGATEGDPA